MRTAGALSPGENGTPFPNGFDRPDRNSSVNLSTAHYTKARDYFVGKIGARADVEPDRIHGHPFAIRPRAPPSAITAACEAPLGPTKT